MPTVECIRAALAAGREPTDLERTEGPMAAVAAIVRETSTRETEVLLIKRADREGDPWSGHMGFPGGRRDPSDASPLETAIRETREELGLDLAAHATLLGRLPPLPAVSRMKSRGMLVFPYVFELQATGDFTPNHEVSFVTWGNLRAMKHGQLDSTLPYAWKGTTLDMPGYRVGEEIVWGMTHRMLVSLFEKLG